MISTLALKRQYVPWAVQVGNDGVGFVFGGDTPDAIDVQWLHVENWTFEDGSWYQGNLTVDTLVSDLGESGQGAPGMAISTNHVHSDYYTRVTAAAPANGGFSTYARGELLWNIVDPNPGEPHGDLARITGFVQIDYVKAPDSGLQSWAYVRVNSGPVTVWTDPTGDRLSVAAVNESSPTGVRSAEIADFKTRGGSVLVPFDAIVYPSNFSVYYESEMQSAVSAEPGQGVSALTELHWTYQITSIDYI
ncbi:MAG TPA: hypothetical protein VF590_01580 [Isosphaeraceae bacterium]|jgi:hypothetical protein